MYDDEIDKINEGFVSTHREVMDKENYARGFAKGWIEGWDERYPERKKIYDIEIARAREAGWSEAEIEQLKNSYAEEDHFICMWDMSKMLLKKNIPEELVAELSGFLLDEVRKLKAEMEN